MKRFFLSLLCVAMTVNLLAIDGALPGVFTINGVKVRFSKGNLQYQASSNTWRFADKQWEVIGEANENISPTYAGWIDLFGWGTSGYNGHYPYMTTTDDAAYGEARTPITDTNYDWGVYNPISNGGNKAGLWHIMDGVDKEDWYYLLKERAKANELWGTGTINGINGLILLPDDWTLPSGGHFVSTTIEYDSYNSKFEDYYKNNHFEDNKYTIDEWQIMEDAGAVFLPVAGLRKGNEYKAEADAYQENPSELTGCYWTSSVPGSWFNLHYKEKAGYSGHVLKFTKDKVIVTALIGGINWRKSDDFEHNFSYGFAVRLVTTYIDDEQDSYRVKITQPEHGTITLKETGIDLSAVEPNTVLHFIATPDEGYYLEAWSGCKSDGSLTVTKNVTVTCSFKKAAEEKKLTGKFTVDAEGKQVIFSQGNLQFNAKQGIWQFAENQYDIIGDGNANISATYAGWIDLFGWGTSGYNSRNPWMTSEDNAQYGDGNKDITATDYDWGQYCSITNGGQKAGLWQTLTFDEWMYIIDNRTDAKLYRGQAAVAEVEGYVLLPDEWALPDGVTFSSTEKNTYTAEQWKTMEDAGAVFLPCGGMRKETTVNHPNEVGIYWASSQDPDDVSKAMSVYIYGKFFIENKNERSHGLSVRLVRDALPSYTVQFTDKDDTQLKTLSAKQGTKVNAEDIPDASLLTWDCHAFDGWQNSLTGDIMTAEQIAEAGVMADVTYKAHYKILTYKVTLACEHGTVSVTESGVNVDAVECGTYLHFSVTPEEGYLFDKWLFEYDDLTGYEVTDNVTLTAQTKIQTFTVTFVDYDGEKVLKTETVNWKESATAPADPVREGYTFTGWDKAFDNVTADIKVTAQYEEVTTVYYTVTYFDWDLTLLGTEKVEEGHDAKGWEPEPEREGYTFTGWSKPLTNITADVNVMAQFEVTKVWYTVTYFDWDLTILGTEKVEEGHDAEGWKPEPEREGYTFTGWSKPLTNITADMNVLAQYEKKGATAIGEMETDTDTQTAQPATRILRNGTLYILRNGILYTPHGYRIN